MLVANCKMIESFVKSSVRGRSIDVLCVEGSLRPILFRLSRSVDSFELIPEDGGRIHTIYLMRILSVTACGTDPQTMGEFAHLVNGLDDQCTVVELHDGSCFTLRFRGAGVFPAYAAKT